MTGPAKPVGESVGDAVFKFSDRQRLFQVEEPYASGMYTFYSTHSRDHWGDYYG